MEMRGKTAEQRGTKNDTLNKWRRIIAKQRREYLDSLRIRNQPKR
jgi:hypothetical protein